MFMNQLNLRRTNNKWSQRIDWMGKAAKKSSYNTRKQWENSWKSTKKWDWQRWIFFYNRTIESDDMDRNYYLIYKQEVDILWSLIVGSIFFFQMNIILYYYLCGCKKNVIIIATSTSSTISGSCLTFYICWRSKRKKFWVDRKCLSL